MSLQVPDDARLLHIYANPQEDDGSSYAGWAALWLDGYRAGCLVRPNVETPRELDVAEAWRDMGIVNQTREEYAAFVAGYGYGKRAVTTSAWKPWYTPVMIAAIMTSFVGGFLWAVIL